MSKVEMTPEEMEAREQEEFNTGPLRLEIRVIIIIHRYHFLSSKGNVCQNHAN